MNYYDLNILEAIGVMSISCLMLYSGYKLSLVTYMIYHNCGNFIKELYIFNSNLKLVNNSILFFSTTDDISQLINNNQLLIEISNNIKNIVGKSKIIEDSTKKNANNLNAITIIQSIDFAIKMFNLIVNNKDFCNKIANLVEIAVSHVNKIFGNNIDYTCTGFTYKDEVNDKNTVDKKSEKININNQNINDTKPVSDDKINIGNINDVLNNISNNEYLLDSTKILANYGVKHDNNESAFLTNLANIIDIKSI